MAQEKSCVSNLGTSEETQQPDLEYWALHADHGAAMGWWKLPDDNLFHVKASVLQISHMSCNRGVVLADNISSV